MENSETKKILVVDDEPEVREVVSRLLEEHGYGVSQAENASEAMDIFTEEVFDLIITDVKMPGEFSGIDLLKIIRAGFETPVIVMSGYGSMELALDAMRHGASEFVQKPLSFPALISIVNGILIGRSKTSREYRLGDLLFMTRFELNNEPGELGPLQKYLVDTAVQVGLSEIRASSLWLSSKEAIKNAMIHGNMMHVGKKVCLLISNMPREIAVTVADEGLGFSLQETGSGNEGLEKHHMRGLEMIESLADDVQFNEKGNEIKIIFLK